MRGDPLWLGRLPALGKLPRLALKQQRRGFGVGDMEQMK